MRSLCIPILACFCHSTCHRTAPPAPVTPVSAQEVVQAVSARGQYVEARTASVFAGACHYGGEYTTAGREALLAWHFDGGDWRGVDLSGENVVLAVAGDANLAEADGGLHRAVLYLDARSPRERRDAAADLVLAHCRDLVKDAKRVVCADLSVELGGETYSVRAPKFELTGSKLENRACCKMPFDVWYTPFADGVATVVGCNSMFRFDDEALGRTWKRSGQNESFVGRFAWTPDSALAPRTASTIAAGAADSGATLADAGVAAAR
jgi:hypothetical protein